ncbi:MAG TPA: aminoacyl-tRNA hydrolase [Puia sp.]|nr:aminoacyl-tRNA hydrolase [Puia sp.]
MSDTKQVIVMRTKYPDGNGGTFGLRKGKSISQGAHASMAFITRRWQWDESGSSRFNLNLSAVEQKWLEDSFAKVCLQVDTEEELLEIERKAKEAGLECHVVTDSGRTEFGGVPQKTCLAIGPDYCEKIDKITGHLELY